LAQEKANTLLLDKETFSRQKAAEDAEVRERERLAKADTE
jgi:hypothetical protein